MSNWKRSRPHTHTHTHARAHARTHIHTHSHSLTHTLSHTHAHTHTREREFERNIEIIARLSTKLTARERNCWHLDAPQREDSDLDSLHMQNRIVAEQTSAKFESLNHSATASTLQRTSTLQQVLCISTLGGVLVDVLVCTSSKLLTNAPAAEAETVMGSNIVYWNCPGAGPGDGSVGCPCDIRSSCTVEHSRREREDT